MDLLQYINDMPSKDIYQVLCDLNGTVADWAASLGVSSILFFAIGLAVALILGFAGYKLIKLVMGISVGSIGYFVGAALFDFLAPKWDWLPSWGVYVFGGVLAVAFLCLAFAKFSYAVFSVFAVAGYCMTSFYLDHQMLAIGGGILLAMLSVTLIRWVFILATSWMCGFFAISFLSQLLPKLELLQMEEGNWFSLCCAVALTLVFAVFQLVVTRKHKDVFADD